MAPIVLFVYNRPLHTLRTLKALAANGLAKDSILYVYADGPKHEAEEDTLNKIKQTRNVLRQQQWCGEVCIIERDKNKGLANSIIDGVTEIVNKHGRVIVLEDDLNLSPYFLHYMNDSLSRYNLDLRVGQIGACNFFANGNKYPTQFFIPMPDCWGWAVWKDRWDYFNADAQQLMYLLRKDANTMSIFNAYNSYNFEEMLQMQIEGKINSWAIRWQAVCVLNNWLNLYPNKSMTNHIQSNEATHANINIIPPLQLKRLKLKTVEIKTLPAVINAMKLGYAGKGNYFGEEILGGSIKNSFKIKERIKILPSLLRKAITR